MSKPAPIDGLDSDTPLEAAARRVLAARLADVRAFEARLAAGCDPDDVHDMRVASRRLRAALELFDRKRQLAAAHDAVRALGDALGEVRELQVQLAWLAAAAAHASPAERPGIDALAAARQSRLPRRLDRMHRALSRWVTEDAAAVETACHRLETRGRLGGRRIRKRLTRRAKQVTRRATAAQRSPDPRTAHRLRIAVKKLRYVAEICQPAFPARIAPLLARLTPLQETLGQLHDTDVHIALTEKFLVDADATTRPGALALLRTSLAQRERLAADLAATIEQGAGEPLEQLRGPRC